MAAIRRRWGQHPKTELRAARLERGLQLAEVAERLGVSAATASRIETRQRSVDSDRQREYARILRRKRSDLFDMDYAKVADEG